MQTPTNADPLDADPLDADPRACTPPTCRPPGCRTPTRCRPPLDADLPQMQNPPGHVTCDTCWETTHPCGQTNTCENIILPQTSFAGGNNRFTLPCQGLAPPYGKSWMRHWLPWQSVPFSIRFLLHDPQTYIST